MRISDWSSDVCSSDLLRRLTGYGPAQQLRLACAGPNAQSPGIARPRIRDRRRSVHRNPGDLMMSIEGKTAFVSGAGRNIGRAIALEFAQRGCNVVVNGLSNSDACEKKAEAVRQRGATEFVARGGAGTTRAVRQTAKTTHAKFGEVDNARK